MRWIVASIFILATAALGGAIWLRPPTDSSSVAAWVQAIGSIAAIATSVGLVGWQAHRDRQAEGAREVATTTRHLRASLQVVRALAGVAGEISKGDFRITAQDVNPMLANVGPLDGALRAGDHTQMPTQESLLAILRAMGASRELLDQIERAKENGLRINASLAREELIGEAKRLRLNLDKQAEVLDLELTKLGKSVI